MFGGPQSAVRKSRPRFRLTQIDAAGPDCEQGRLRSSPPPESVGDCLGIGTEQAETNCSTWLQVSLPISPPGMSRPLFQGALFPGAGRGRAVKPESRWEARRVGDLLQPRLESIKW